MTGPRWGFGQIDPDLRTLLLAVLLAQAYFVGPPAWNQNSRLALTRAIVEDHRLEIDEFHVTTGDKSFRDGHFYSDKAPGVSFMAVPAYAAFWGLRWATGGDPPGFEVAPLDPNDAAAGRAPPADRLEPGDRIVYNLAHRAALWWCRVATVSILALGGAFAFWSLLCSATLSRAVSLWATAIYALATPAFAYACGLYGHRPAADLLLIAFAGASLWPRRRVFDLAIGTCLAWAVLCEYTALAPAALLAGFSAQRRGLGSLVSIGSAALPWAALLLTYHFIAFGHPFATGYDFVYLPEFAAGMRERYGLGPPDLSALLSLTFGNYRGLFYLSPVLLLAVWGLWGSLPDRGQRLVATLICAYYACLASGYYMWDGGASFGPRHALPAIAFLALGIARPLVRVPFAVLVLAAWSGFNTLIGTAAGPESPTHSDPIWAHAVPATLWSEPAATRGATDLGQMLGLPPAASLALIALVVALILAKPMIRAARTLRFSADSTASSSNSSSS